MREWRQQAEHRGDVLFVTGDQIALQTAVGTIGEHVERRTAQNLQFRQEAKYRHHPRAERALARPPQRIGFAGQHRRREVEVEFEIALELIAELLFEPAVGVEPRDLVLILVGEQFCVVDRDRTRQRVAKTAIGRRIANLHHGVAITRGKFCVLILGEVARCGVR